MDCISVVKDLLNLKSLSFEDNNIKDISAIKDLKCLEMLNASYNAIEDISPVKGIYALEYLNLSYNDIKEVLSVSKLTNLEILNIVCNRVKDISSLKHLRNIRNFDMQNQRVYIENFNEVEVRDVNDTLEFSFITGSLESGLDIAVLATFQSSKNDFNGEIVLSLK